MIFSSFFGKKLREKREPSIALLCCCLCLACLCISLYKFIYIHISRQLKFILLVYVFFFFSLVCYVVVLLLANAVRKGPAHLFREGKYALQAMQGKINFQDIWTVFRHYEICLIRWVHLNIRSLSYVNSNSCQIFYFLWIQGYFSNFVIKSEISM